MFSEKCLRRNADVPIGRIGWIDAWKAILIVLVVAGHVIGMVSHYVPACDRSCYEFLFKTIYSFHMPAFFMLAGIMTSEVSLGRPIACQFGKLFRRLLTPYFFFGVLSAIVYTFAFPYFDALSASSSGYYDQFIVGKWWHPWTSVLYGAAFPGSDGFRCNSVLWFLPCMFSVKLIAHLLGPIMKTRKIHLVAIILCVCVVGYAQQFFHVPTLPYGLTSALWYFPFLLVGYCLRSVLTAESCLAKNVFRSIVILSAILFCLLIWILPNNTIHARLEVRWYIVEVVLGILGGTLSIAVAKRISEKFSRVCFGVAVNSIGIMFLHKYVVLLMIIGIPQLRRLLTVLPLGATLMISLVIIALSSSLSGAMSDFLRRVAPWILGEH